MFINALRLLPVYTILVCVALASCSGGGGGSAPAPPSADSTPALALFAGAIGGSGTADGVGGEARFNFPRGLARDTAGNIYVADTNNHTIRKIDASGRVTTIAGAPGQAGNQDGSGADARFFGPTDIGVDAAGVLYVSDASNHGIRRITPNGQVTTVAGGSGPGSDDGLGRGARFHYPLGIAVDTAGNLFVADSANFTIRKITPAGVVSTFAGAAGQRGNVDGAGADARFESVHDVALDAMGHVYVPDAGNQTIRRITAGGVVSTLAGKPGSAGNIDGSMAEATFRDPTGVAVDATGNIYILERARFNDPAKGIRRITPSGDVATVATLGSGVEAVVAGDGGRLYLADSSGSVIQSLEPDGRLTTIAGAPPQSGNADGVGSNARFGGRLSLATDPGGTLYALDSGNGNVRRIDRDARVTTIFTRAWIFPELPSSVAADAFGNLYVGSSGCTGGRGSFPTCTGALYKRSAAGDVLEITPGSASGGVQPRLRAIPDLVVDAAGNLYVTDVGALSFAVRRIAADGTVSTFVPDRPGAVRGMAMDRSGNLFVSDQVAIRKITPSGEFSTFAGGESSGSADGVGAAARFNTLGGIALDESHNLYVADTGNHTVRKVTSAGVVTTIAGRAGQQGFHPGVLPGLLSEPHDVAIVGADLYITMPSGIAIIRNRP